MIIRALMNIIGSYWNLRWRRCIGIEPIYDSVSAARAGLKSGAPTSGASISENNFSDLQFSVFSKSILYAFLYAFRINLSIQSLRNWLPSLKSFIRTKVRKSLCADRRFVAFFSASRWSPMRADYLYYYINNLLLN